MNRAIAQLCILIGAVSVLGGCAGPGPIGVARFPSGEDQQRTASGWKIKFDASDSNPVIVDGVLYMGSADGAVYALDPKSGETKWRFQTSENLSPATSGPQLITVPRGSSIADQMTAGINAAEEQRKLGTRRVEMTPAVKNGTVFIGSEDQSFYAIDAATGTKKWSYLAGPGMASEPAAVLENGTVCFVTEDGLHALDALTGKRKWLFQTLQEIPVEEMNFGKRVPSGPVLGDGVIFLTAWPTVRLETPKKSFLYAVDPESGQAKWVTSVDGLDITAPTTAKGLVFFAVEEPAPVFPLSSNRVTLYAIEAAGGQLKWKVGAERNYGTPALLIAGNTIYFSTDKSLLTLELETGRQLWTFSAAKIWGGVFASSPGLLVDDQHVYVVTHKDSILWPKDTLHALAVSTGHEKWSQSLSGSVRLAMVNDGVVYADGEHLYAIEASTGKKLWSFKGTVRESARLISGGRIFLSSPTVGYVGMERADQGYLCAIDARTGKLKP